MSRVKRSQEEVGVNMTPMIDIVFQLIIFFVVTTKLDSDTFDARIMLAFAPDGPAVEQKDPRTIIVDVDPRGRVSIARTGMSLTTLTAVLRQAVAQYGASTPVHIRGDRSVEHDHIRALLDACGRAGVWRVSFIATKEAAKESG